MEGVRMDEATKKQLWTTEDEVYLGMYRTSLVECIHH